MSCYNVHQLIINLWLIARWEKKWHYDFIKSAKISKNSQEVILMLDMYIWWFLQNFLQVCTKRSQWFWSEWPFQFSSVQSLSRVWLFATPWIAACQASLSITSSRSSPKLMSIESVMPSSHLIVCHPLLLLPPHPSQHQGLFQWVNSSHQVAKVLEFQL